MKITKSLSDYQFLKSPSLDIDLSFPCPLLKYSTEDAIQIAKNVVFSVSNALNHKFPDEQLDWLLTCFGYSLRIEDPTSQIYRKALQFYSHLIITFFFESDKSRTKESNQKYLKICLCHLSQIFLNDSFLETDNQSLTPGFLQVITSCYTDNNYELSLQAITLFTKFLINACYDLLTAKPPYQGKNEVVKELQENVLKIIEKPNRELLEQIDSNLSKLFKFDVFRTAWIQSFNELYKNKINGNGFDDNRRFVLNYFSTKINGFPKPDKDKAFSNVVMLWKQTNRNDSNAFKKWPTDEIKNDYFEWISINIPNIGKYHPLFELIKYGDEEKGKELHEMANNHIDFQLSTPEGKETDLFWYLPVYAYDFFMTNPFTLSKFGVISFSQRYIKSELKDVEINLHLMYLVNYIYMIKKNDETYVNTLTNLIYKPLEDFPYNLTLIIPSLLLFLFCQRNDFFWYQFNQYINAKATEEIHKFTNNLSNLFLLTSLLIDFEGNEFNKITKNLTISPIKDKVWNVIDSLTLTFHDKLRFLLSFYILSIKNIFLINSNEINRFLNKDNNETNESLSKLNQMCKLALITGGKILKCNSQYAITENTKMYISNDYIFSIHNDNQIVIRHALGMTIYNIKDITKYSYNLPSENFTFQNLKSYDTFGKDCFKPKNNSISETYQKAFDDMEKMFQEEEFVEYEDHERNDNTSIAHSLLIDIGFISLNSSTLILLPNKKNNVDALDRLESKLFFDIYIFQLIESNNKFEISSNDSIEFKNFITKINDSINTNIFNYKFKAIPMIKGRNINDFKVEQQNLGFIFIYNETGNLINLHSKDFNNYTMVASISEYNHDENENDFYVFEIRLNDDAVLGCRELRFYINIEQVSILLAVLYVMFLTKNADDIKIKKITAKFSQRLNMIHGIAESITKEEREVAKDLLQQFLLC